MIQRQLIILLQEFKSKLLVQKLPKQQGLNKILRNFKKNSKKFNRN